MPASSRWITPAGEGAGNIFGDFTGTRMGIELGGPTAGGKPRIRGRSSFQTELVADFGWNWMVFETNTGAGITQLNGGLQLPGAASIDGNLFQVGLASVPTTVAIAAWGYATTPLISNGAASVINTWFRYIIGARTS
ncbi:hypothetical protein [Roseisalinus antarcticus]|uniref:Uncharacterized protein n=1 Tax=Roseisalinus antarcticus TaxID=254357 RepID=A0A1Y5U015_9RHOB|nr:hypothetical protein [Roseisalinus antarcticus]SLN75061.1 hypothetical protein ROA7023_03885 [Roseisalinus antarcticus]